MRKKLKSPTYIGILVFLALLFFIAPIDTDLGWHLRYGEHFLNTGKFMRTNELTYLVPGYLWPNSYTLYQILTTMIYKYVGLIGLSIAYSVLMVITFIGYDHINPKFTRVNFLLFLFISLFGWKVLHLGFRAQVFTISFLVLIYYLLKHAKPKTLAILSLPIFAIWVNLHGGYILGLIVLGFAVIDPLINKDKERSTYLSIAIVLGFIGTLINPYTYKVYEEAFRHMQVPMHTLIAEWVRPTPIYAILTVILGLLAIFAQFKYKSKEKAFWGLNLATFSYLALEARRNLPEFILAFTLSLYEPFKKQFDKIESNQAVQLIVTLVLMTGIPFLLFTSSSTNYKLTSSQDYYCQNGILPLPCDAIGYIKDNDIEGQNVYSSYEWGGYLSWQLPQYNFFVDGRTPAWPTNEDKSPYTIYLEIIQARVGYQERLDGYGTDWLLIGKGTFLDLELQENEDSPWKEQYRDDIAVIYIKS